MRKMETNILQGYPEDLVVSVALGADMFDCVWPTRTAVWYLSSYWAMAWTLILTAIWECHHFVGDLEPATCVICR